MRLEAIVPCDLRFGPGSGPAGNMSGAHLDDSAVRDHTPNLPDFSVCNSNAAKSPINVCRQFTDKPQAVGQSVNHDVAAGCDTSFFWPGRHPPAARTRAATMAMITVLFMSPFRTQRAEVGRPVVGPAAPLVGTYGVLPTTLLTRLVNSYGNKMVEFFSVAISAMV
jgi:hypothetical protein